MICMGISMGSIVGIVVLILFAVFLAVILVRAVRFAPERKEKNQITEVSLNREKIIEDMAEMIRCKTVSYTEEELICWEEFTKFEQVLQERFPLIYKACSFTKIGKTGLLYHLQGR